MGGHHCTAYLLSQGKEEGEREPRDWYVGMRGMGRLSNPTESSPDARGEQWWALGM